MTEDRLLLTFTSRDPTSPDCRGRQWTRVRRGAHYPTEAWQLLDRRARHALLVYATAHCWTAQPGVVSHESAAALWGLPVVGAWPERVQLSTTGDSRRSQGALQIHRITGAEPRHVVRDGLRVTTLEQTVIDLARSRPFRSGLATADAALNRRLVQRADLLDVVDALPTPAPGRAIARLVARLSDPLAESVLESLSRAVMYEAGLPRPRLQVRLADAHGPFGRGDFGWPGLIGECDGAMKYGADLSKGDPSSAVLREKQREDRIRRFSDVARWGWADAYAGRPLVRLLVGKGLRVGRPADWF